MIQRQSCFVPTHSTVGYFCLFFELAKKSTPSACLLEAYFLQFNTVLVISPAQSTLVLCSG